MHTKSQNVIGSLLKLHHWRRQFNGEYIGYGYDPYKPVKKYHYAEAYGLWGQGYVALYNLTHESCYLGLAKRCVDWLLDNSCTDDDSPSWGLPWSWEVWEAPKNLSYVTTTVFVGNLFIYLYKATLESAYLNVAVNIANWIFEGNGVTQTGDGLWVHYANHSPLRYPIINAIALASGYFWQVYECTSIDYYQHLAYETARYVFSRQKSCGKWLYSMKSSVVDNLHTGYTLEGLWQGYSFWDTQALEKIRLGSEFYWNQFYSSSGYGQEQWNETWKAYIKWLLMKLGWRYKITETRLWGYGAAMRAFALAAVADKNWLHKATKIYVYIERNLSLESGAYAYRATDPSVYIRHQAHIFTGLGQLAQALKEIECP